MTSTEKNRQSAWATIQRLLKIAGMQRRWLYLALVVDLIQAGLMIASNHFIRTLFDAATAKDSATFWLFVTFLMVTFLVGFPLSYLRTRGMGQFSERTLARLRQQIAARSAVLPMGYVEERHSGDLLSVLNADLGKLKTLLANNLIDLPSMSVRAIAAFIYIVSINWILALVAVVLTPLIFLLVSALTKPVEKRSAEMQEEIGQVNSVAQDGISGAMVVKSFNLAEVINQRFRLANQRALAKGLRIAWLRAFIDGFSFGLMIIPFILAFGLGGYMVMQHQITFGALFAFVNLLNFVVNPLGGIPNVMASIGEANGAAQRVFELVDHPSERTAGSVTLPDRTADLAVQLRDVTFTYASAGAPILKNISLDLPAGKTIALVGPSGGGKSTLAKLILGYYPVTQGKISLFGQPLNEWSLSAAREQMAFVAQDTYLFPVSIGENIRLGKPGAPQAEVERAAQLANIHDFLLTLPQGYNTPAGEWGSRLSGGQKQRISLARAILKDAPILLLDEPTSALDTESEALVQQALDRFSAHRTTLVIAHRLSTIKNADWVVVLSDGQIAEQGTHESLMARGGIYLDLYQQQFQLNAAVQPPTVQAILAEE